MPTVRSLLFLLLVLCMQFCAASPAAAASGAETGLLINQTLAVAGEQRSYHLIVPATPAQAPVLLLFHGHSSSADELLGLNGAPSPFALWLDIARRENLIVVVPNGLVRSSSEKGWNDCRADAPTNSRADDVLFANRLLDRIFERYGADPRRVFASGVSNGGHMAIRLALEMPHRLTGFAAINAANAGNSKCAASTVRVPALFMNGTADPLLPYEGGQMASGRGLVLSTQASVEQWVSRNGAAALPTLSVLPDRDPGDGSRVEKYVHSGSAPVLLYKVLGGGHTAPSLSQRYSAQTLRVLGAQNADIEMAEEVWAFFSPLRAAPPLGRLNAVLFDPAAAGDGLYLVSDPNTVSVAFFGYGAPGQPLWLFGARPRAELAPRLGEDLVFPLFRSGSGGRFLLPQDPGSAPLPVWGTLSLRFSCSAGAAPRLIGSARFEGADGIKTMTLESLVTDAEACAVSP
jgi:polyhydroxybutyrate depolymerase